jgi:hypothetical protein
VAKKKQKAWAHIRGLYPQAVSDDQKDASFAGLVAAERSALEGRDVMDLCAEWNGFEAQKDALELQISELNVKIVARERAVFAYMDAKDLEDLTVGDGHFSRDTDVSCKQDKRLVVEWALKEMPEIVSVHAGTLASQVKDALRKGTPIPDGVTVEVRDRIKRTAA